MVVFTQALRAFIVDGLDSIIKTMTYTDKIEAAIESIYSNIVTIDSVSDLEEKRKFIIIDEIQDLEEWQFKRLFLNSNIVMAFGDFEQILYNGRLQKEDFDKIPYNNLRRYNLNICHRLPRTVANFAQQIIINNLEEKCLVKNNEHKPYLIKCEISSDKKYYFEKEIECIVDIIYKNNLKDVGILVNDNDSLNKVYFLVKNLIDKKYKNNPQKRPEIGFKYNNIIKLKFGTMNSINILCLHSCKGTEFQNVFIAKCDIDSIRTSNDLNYKQALYVACTRTAQRLFITYSKPICRFIPYYNKELYNEYRYDNNQLIQCEVKGGLSNEILY